MLTTCLIYEKLLGWRKAAEGTPNKVFYVIHPFVSGVGLGVFLEWPTEHAPDVLRSQSLVWSSESHNPNTSGLGLEGEEKNMSHEVPLTERMFKHRDLLTNDVEEIDGELCCSPCQMSLTISQLKLCYRSWMDKRKECCILCKSGFPGHKMWYGSLA